MPEIQLNRIEVKENQITYFFGVSEELACFFRLENHFVIQYFKNGAPINLNHIPDSILAIPFVCNVLPIAWLTNSTIVLHELDQAFFDCLPNIKRGYEEMFPESVFSGEIKVERLVSSNTHSTGQCAAFFSGGLDATQTLVSHFDENPHLISVWGSDIWFDNEDGWRNTHQSIAETSKRFSLPDVVIRSSFREFDCESALDKRFSAQLKDGWWHGVKHGIGLLGHAAPYAFLEGLDTVYIASSNCPADGPVRCASSPLIDNHVRFHGCRVVHDGFHFSRQDKAHNIVRYCETTGRDFFVHVCWESQSGHNCCRCEKCYRTIAAIIVEGACPEKYGFDRTLDTLPAMQRFLIGENKLTPFLSETQWVHIRERFLANTEVLKKTVYWKHIRWFQHSDFANPNTIKMPLLYRVKRKVALSLPYRALSRIKRKIRG